MHVEYTNRFIDRPIAQSFLRSMFVLLYLFAASRLNKCISLCPTVLDVPDYAFLPRPFHDDKTHFFMFELKVGELLDDLLYLHPTYNLLA